MMLPATAAVYGDTTPMASATALLAGPTIDDPVSLPAA
jgi:hypothetical protein